MIELTLSALQAVADLSGLTSFGGAVPWWILLAQISAHLSGLKSFGGLVEFLPDFVHLRWWH